METPKGYSETEVIDIITKVSNRFVGKFVFNSYDRDDLLQEAFIIGMEGLERYDPNTGPLENFLHKHIYNRIINFKRKVYGRPMELCESCGDDICEKCKKSKTLWNSRRNLTDPIDLGSVKDEEEKSMKTYTDITNNVELREIETLVNQYLPVELRPDYLRFKDGCNISKTRRNKIEEYLEDILLEHYDEE